MFGGGETCGIFKQYLFSRSESESQLGLNHPDGSLQRVELHRGIFTFLYYFFSLSSNKD
jgi:hypothetical protein